MTTEFTKQRIAQRKGRTLSFEGKLLCSTDWSNRDGVRTVLELWETRAGNWIAVTAFEPDRPDASRDTAQAVVIDRQGDEKAMHDAAMDAWEWHFRARSMVKDQLKWSLTREVP